MEYIVTGLKVTTQASDCFEPINLTIGAEDIIINDNAVDVMINNARIKLVNVEVTPLSTYLEQEQVWRRFNQLAIEYSKEYTESSYGVLAEFYAQAVAHLKYRLDHLLRPDCKVHCPAMDMARCFSELRRLGSQVKAMHARSNK